MTITLTHDQQKAVSALTAFLGDEDQHAFVLSGYAGTGKSTLIRHILADLDKTMKALRLINQHLPYYDLQLTATTNKAADNLATITGQQVPTIHSFLGLRVETDYKTRETRLVPSNKPDQENVLLFVDEASYIDSELLTMIFQRVKKSKVIFIGDPAQLIPIKAKNAPVFNAPFPGAKLTQIVRQAQGNPVLELATKFRETVASGEWFKFVPDGSYVQHLQGKDFEQAVRAEFTRHDWKSNQSKLLGWTNKVTEAYSKIISSWCVGRTGFAVGDYVQCNKFFNKGKYSVKTDETVLITGMSGKQTVHGVDGHYYTLNEKVTAFCPDHLADKKAALKLAKANDDTGLVAKIEEDWIDLRPVYACTINKSQGSTYDRVFIDLNDLKRCNSGETMARLLYVGVSRARHQVILTGDLV